MAELFSQYASGVQFSAGTITGSVSGVSGINPIVDRLNSISDDNGIVNGSFAGPTASGTNLTIYATGQFSGTTAIAYLSGGQIDKVPSVGDDITNKTYVDSGKVYNKRDGNYGNNVGSGTAILSFDYTEDRYTYLIIESDLGATSDSPFVVAFYDGATKCGETGIIHTLPAGTYQTAVTTIISPKPTQHNYPVVTYETIKTGGNNAAPNWGNPTVDSRGQCFMDLTPQHPDTIKIIIASGTAQYQDINYQYYQL